MCITEKHAAVTCAELSKDGTCIALGTKDSNVRVVRYRLKHFMNSDLAMILEALGAQGKRRCAMITNPIFLIQIYLQPDDVNHSIQIPQYLPIVSLISYVTTCL